MSAGSDMPPVATPTVEGPLSPKQLNGLLAAAEADFAARLQALQDQLQAARSEAEQQAGVARRAEQARQQLDVALSRAREHQVAERLVLERELARVQALHEEAARRAEELSVLPALLRRSDRRLAELALSLEQLELTLSTRPAPAAPQAAAPPEPEPEPAAQEILHVDDLFTVPGESFVSLAYSTLLGRAADPSGAAFFNERVRSRNDRAAIIFELATSAEGRARALALPGLAELVRQQQPRTGRIGAWRQGFLQALAAIPRLHKALESQEARARTRLARIDERLRHLETARSVVSPIAEPAADATPERLQQLADGLAQCTQALTELRAGLALQGQGAQAGLPLQPAVAAEAQTPHEAALAGSADPISLDATRGAPAALAQLAAQLASSAAAQQLARGRTRR